LEQRLSDSGRFGILLFIAWRNVGRNLIRSSLTISALAAGLAMVIFYSALMEGMIRQMILFATDISTGHMQIHRQAYIDDQDMYATIPWSYESALQEAYPKLTFAPRLYASGLASTQQSSTGVSIKAIDPEKEAKATRLLDQVEFGITDLLGRWKNQEGLDVSAVMIGAQLAKNLQLKPGDELILVTQAADGSIGNALYRVQGIFKPIEPNFDRTGVLMSIASFKQLMYLENGFHELLIKIDDIGQLAHEQSSLKVFLLDDRSVLRSSADNLPSSRTNVSFFQLEPLDELGGGIRVRNWQELAPSVSDMLAVSQSVVWLVGFIIVGLAAFGVLNTMLMAVHERHHEFGILMAIGMKPMFVMAMVLLESLFLGLIASVIGSVMGVLISTYFTTHPIDFSSMMPQGFDWGGMVFQPVLAMHLELVYVWGSCLLLISITLLAALVPSWKILKLKPAEAL
jgi:ABC-type lipoprotein release transport system permease subunit